MKRQAAEKRGRGAETFAALYLRLKGWRILARRARVPGGEVDIVARRGRTLAFVEVKARGSQESAAFALDRYRLRRVAEVLHQVGEDARRNALFDVQFHDVNYSRPPRGRLSLTSTERLDL